MTASTAVLNSYYHPYFFANLLSLTLLNVLKSSDTELLEAVEPSLSEFRISLAQCSLMLDKVHIPIFYI
jgi:hypothetical protein